MRGACLRDQRWGGNPPASPGLLVGGAEWGGGVCASACAVTHGTVAVGISVFPIVCGPLCNADIRTLGFVVLGGSPVLHGCPVSSLPGVLGTLPAGEAGVHLAAPCALPPSALPMQGLWGPQAACCCTLGEDLRRGRCSPSGCRPSAAARGQHLLRTPACGQ